MIHVITVLLIRLCIISFQHRLTASMSQELPQIDSGDLQRLGEVSEQINSAAEKHHVDPNVLAGIASRESNVGAALKGGYGDDGKAYGVNQVDLNAHPGADQVGGPTSQEHFDQSAQILQHNTEQVRQSSPLSETYQSTMMCIKGCKRSSRVDFGSTTARWSCSLQLRYQECSNC